MMRSVKWFLCCTIVSLMALQSLGQQDAGYQPEADKRQGRDLLDWIGLGTGPDTDPYLARTNAECINGDLAECFKSRALASLDEFFDKSSYELSENARILRMPSSQLRQLAHEPFEFSDSPRTDEPEWDQLIKFIMRKVERFVKSTGIEVQIDNDVTERGRYSPRFVDEIVDEIDVIEDKKDSLFKRKQLKKLFIPLLLVLKIFKLKLLLFLPLILGMATFKKLLGFLAIIVPGAIAFFRFCKPDFSSAFSPSHGSYYNYNKPHYSPAGVAYPPHFRDPQPSFVHEGSYGGSHGINFGEDDHAQHLAYSGYGHYRDSGKDVEAEADTTSKKSILPDS